MKALVTGGGGFLGSRIVQRLHERGDDVVALGRRRYPRLERAGIRTVQADVRDAEQLLKACAGMDVVFHTAAIAGIWGKTETYRGINVTGTRNVVDACRTCGIRKLVFTSSPSVVFGADPVCGIDESEPYPKRHLAVYSATKAEAERIVLGANSSELSTVALRPHLIWGPGDPHLIPRVIDRARRGRWVQVGDGENLVDITYIDNAAEAHLQAADALSPASRCAGRSYFLSQGQPVRLWDWLNEILVGVGLSRATRTISYATAYRIGWLLEIVYRVLAVVREPIMTRFLASQLAQSHYFDISAARRDLGYTPSVSTSEGVKRLLASLTHPERPGSWPASVPE